MPPNISLIIWRPFIKELLNEQDYYFFDAIAPIIDASTINYDVVYLKSRYDKGEASYLNCPFTKEQFDARTDNSKRSYEIPCGDTIIYVAHNGYGSNGKVDELMNAVNNADWGLTLAKVVAWELSLRNICTITSTIIDFPAVSNCIGT